MTAPFPLLGPSALSLRCHCAFPAEGPLVRVVQFLLKPPNSSHSRQHPRERLLDFAPKNIGDIAHIVGHGDFPQQFLVFRAFARILAFFDPVLALAIFLVAVASRWADLMTSAKMKSISASDSTCLTLSRVRIFQRFAIFLSRRARSSKSWLMWAANLLRLSGFQIGGNS